MGTILVIKGANFANVAVGQVVPVIKGDPVIVITQNGSVTLTCAGATDIYYTTNGSTPTTNSTRYTGAFNVADGTTIKAIGRFSDNTTSDVTEKTYTHQVVAKPIISISNEGVVQITAYYTADVYYTTDGSTPTINSTLYTGTFSVEDGTTIKAIAIIDGIVSDVETQTYHQALASPTISVSSAGVVTITGASGASLYYTTNGSTPTNASTLYSGTFSVVSGTTIKAVAYKNGNYSEVATATYVSNAPVHTGAAYFIPMISNSTPTEGGPLVVEKENVGGYSQSTGARFPQSGEGICYNIGSTIVRAIAFDFFLDTRNVMANGRFLVNLGAYGGGGGLGNGFYMFTNSNGGSQGYSTWYNGGTADQTLPTPFTTDEWHRVCIAWTGTSMYIFIDGTQVVDDSAAYDMVSVNTGYVILGNGWRFRVNDGDRAFGGNIKNVAIWTNEVSVSDLVAFSTLV